jgi:hypothetical protein
MTYTTAQLESTDLTLDNIFATFEELELTFEETKLENKPFTEPAPKKVDRIEYVSKLGVTNVLILETQAMVNDWNDIKTYSVKTLRGAIKRYEQANLLHRQDLMIMDFALGLKLSK